MIKVLKKNMDDLNKENKIVKRRITKRTPSRIKVSNENVFRSFSTINNVSDFLMNSLDSITVDHRLDLANEFFYQKLNTYDMDVTQSLSEKQCKLKQMKIIYKKIKTFPSESEIVLEGFWKKYSQHSLKNGKTLYYKCKIDEEYCNKKSQVVFNKFTNEIEYYEAEGEHKHLCEVIADLKSSFEMHRPHITSTSLHSFNFDLTETNEDSPHQEEIDYEYHEDEANELNSNANSTSEHFDSLNEDLECAYYSEQNDQVKLSDDKCNLSYIVSNDSPNTVESSEYCSSSNINGNYNCYSINSEGMSTNSSDYYDTSLLENSDYVSDLHYEQNSFSVGSSETPWSLADNFINNEIPSIASFTSDILSNNNNNNIAVYDYDLSKISNDRSSSYVYMNSEGHLTESNL
jgi:hypothetical protein